MASTYEISIEQDKENQCPQRNKGEKFIRQSKRELEQTQTSDSKSKIMIVVQEKKIKAENPENGKQIQEREKADEVNLYTKQPSYFLEVQEQSVIIEEEPFSQLSLDNSQLYAKLSTKEKAYRKLAIRQEEFNSIRDNQLTYSALISTSICSCNWKQENAFIWDHQLCIGATKIHMNEITKAKCLLQRVGYEERKIKIVKGNTAYFFGASTLKKEKQQGHCEHFLWFSKLIYNKLHLMSHSLKQSKPEESLLSSFSIGLPNAICQGSIYKKSQHLRKWEVRYIVITQTELLSYKESGRQPSFTIKSENIKYIWTRFQLHNAHLIVKVKHGVCKTELAIPLMNYSENAAQNWLAALYTLMMENRHRYTV